MKFIVIADDLPVADALVGVVPPDVRVELLLLGASDEEAAAAAKLPVDEVLIPSSLPVNPEPAALGRALQECLSISGPIVLSSTQPARDLAGWFAAMLDAPVVWAIDALRVADGVVEADRVVLGGSHRLVHSLDAASPAIILAKPTVPASAQQRRPRGPRVERLDMPPAEPRVRVVESAGTDAGTVPLAGARVVVSIGRGIGGPDNVPLFGELARALGAGLGASRVAVDSGWLPFAHQVGQTGTAVSPEVYLAFGISGAIQHLAGMRTSRRVIAVNTDSEAPLCRQADLIVKDDAVTVARALLARLHGQGGEDSDDP